MKNQLRSDFQKFLSSGAYATPPGNAQCALDSARTLAEFRQLERAGLVRLEMHEEEESYFSVYGEPEAYTNIFGKHVSADQAKQETVALLDQFGCYWIVSKYWNETYWEVADTVGMCMGYKNPLDPFENSYVIDLMHQAIKKIPQPGEV